MQRGETAKIQVREIRMNRGGRGNAVLYEQRGEAQYL